MPTTALGEDSSNGEETLVRSDTTVVDDDTSTAGGTETAEQTQASEDPEPTVSEETEETEETGKQSASLEDSAATASTADADVAEDSSEALEVQSDAAAADAKAADSAGAAAEVAAPSVSGSGHVQNVGWRDGSTSGGLLSLGTTGRSLRLEALRLRLSSGSISYRAHVQDVGWQSWRSDGAECGTTGRSRRVEALRIRLSDELASQGWSVRYRVHVEGIGWMGWAADGECAGTSGMSRRLEAVEVRVVASGDTACSGGGDAYRDAGLKVQAHVQNVGWQGTRKGYSVTVGTTGRGLRMEALRISRPSLDMTGSISYRAHVQDVGWQGWRSDGDTAGTTGRSRRVEAVRIELSGELADNYDVWYRVHVQNLGWMAWASNGDSAGTQGLSLRMESLQVALVDKGAGAPSSDGQQFGAAFTSREEVGAVGYRAYAGGSWGAWRSGGASAGSSGGQAIKDLSMRLEGGASGGVSYAVHLADLGWRSYVAEGAQAGESGKDVQAVRVKLSGDVESLCNVWYRAYVKGYGWTQWAKNGQDCGSTGMGTPIVDFQVRLMGKESGSQSNRDASIYETCAHNGAAQSTSSINAAQRKLLNAAQSTPWPGVGLCAGWVENVYANAGLGEHTGNACDLYDWYCKSSNLSQLKVGMIIAVRTHTHTSAGSIWGHVGIYVGDGKVMHSVTSGVKTVSLSYWINYYGTTYTPKWGWLGNRNIA